jgi:hypothetical protein
MPPAPPIPLLLLELLLELLDAIPLELLEAIPLLLEAIPLPAVPPSPPDPLVVVLGMGSAGQPSMMTGQSKPR